MVLLVGSERVGHTNNMLVCCREAVVLFYTTGVTPCSSSRHGSSTLLHMKACVVRQGHQIVQTFTLRFPYR